MPTSRTRVRGRWWHRGVIELKYYVPPIKTHLKGILGSFSSATQSFNSQQKYSMSTSSSNNYSVAILQLAFLIHVWIYFIDYIILPFSASFLFFLKLYWHSFFMCVTERYMWKKMYVTISQFWREPSVCWKKA